MERLSGALGGSAVPPARPRALPRRACPPSALRSAYLHTCMWRLSVPSACMSAPCFPTCVDPCTCTRVCVHRSSRALSPCGFGVWLSSGLLTPPLHFAGSTVPAGMVDTGPRQSPARCLLSGEPRAAEPGGLPLEHVALLWWQLGHVWQECNP